MTDRLEMTLDNYYRFMRRAWLVEEQVMVGVDNLSLSCTHTWDSEGKGYLHPVYEFTPYYGDDRLHEDEPIRYLAQEEAILMLCTGYQSADGGIAYVWENDVIETILNDTLRRGVVRYKCGDADAVGFYIENADGKVYHDDSAFYADYYGHQNFFWNQLTVVGNIYEQPELVKKMA